MANTVYENYTFTNFVGPKEAGPGWYDGTENRAHFYHPAGIALDSSNNLIVADANNHLVRKVSPSGIVTTLAGLDNTAGAADGAGAAGRFNYPDRVAVAPDGTIYIADTSNNTIRKITPAGNVTTFAGKAGEWGIANGTGSAARFNSPYGLALDSAGNLYVADTGNDTIRKITPAGAVTLFAGTPGVAGTNNGTGPAAGFYYPYGLAVDSSNNVFVADTDNHTIRKITPKGVVTTVAGQPGTAGTNNGTGAEAQFNQPTGLAFDHNGVLYIADDSNHTIRKMTPDGAVTTLAGAPGVLGGANGTNDTARFYYPFDLVADNSNNVYVADIYNNAIRKVTPDGVVTTIAGTTVSMGSADGMGTNAQFTFPGTAAVDNNDNLWVADYDDYLIRRVTPDGTVSTIAGLAHTPGSSDGTNSTARFNHAFGITVDGAGNAYVADTYNDTIRKVTPDGVVSTIAGLAGTPGVTDATNSNARFYQPFGIAADNSGNLYVADTWNQAIRKVTPDGVVSTFAGLTGYFNTGSADGTNSDARFSYPVGVAVDKNNGNIYVADNGNYLVRKITPAGVVTTLAGSPGVAGSDDGTGSAARFRNIWGITVDASGNIYVADRDDNVVRKITPAGVVTTVGGRAGVPGCADGVSDTVLFNSVEGVAIDGTGNLYVVDSNNHAVRKGIPSVLPDQPIVDLAGGGTGLARHLSISNSTTTSWQWSLVRRPSASMNQLSSTNAASLTFTPDVEDIYVVRFQGWDNSGKYTARLLTIYADNTAPTLSITNVVSGQNWSNAVLTLRGIANDNLQLSNIWVQVNNGSWVSANGTSVWSYDAGLTPGTNVIRAYAQDASGLVSATNTVRLNYIVSSPIDFQITGGGTVTPNYSNAVLQIGKSYTVTAKPPAGYLFSNWTGNAGVVLSTSATYTFVMQTNFVLHANFILNPFTAAQGTYVGLFYDTNGVTAANAGYFSALLSSKGTFSAKLLLGGTSISVAGPVGVGGSVSTNVALKTGGALSVQLQFGFGGNTVSGTIANNGAGWSSQLQGFRNVYSKTNLSPLGGKRFSLVIPGASDASTAPGGYSYGSALVSTLGSVTFAGVLGDGLKAAQSTYISQDGQWPLFISPYAGKGLMIGWLTVSNQPESDLSGTVNWIKLPIPATKYPNGFQITTNAVGSLYSFTTGTPLLNLPSGGVVILDQGNLSQSITNGFTLSSANTVTGSNGLTVAITTTTGLFKGSAPNPATGKAVPFTGVLLQKQNAGFGMFSGTNQTGSVYFGE